MNKKPSVLPEDMTLYADFEPEGRMFCKGEAWPGDAWRMDADAGVEFADKFDELMAKLKEAVALNDNLSRQLDAANRSLAEGAAIRDEAVAKVAGAEEAARIAIGDKVRAETERNAVILERDAARSDLMKAKAQLAKFDRDGDGNPGGAAPKALNADAMAAEYLELTGKPADKRWGPERLAEELANARKVAAAAAE